MIDVIILAGGIGQRTELNYPKQLMRLGGKPILVHVTEILNQIEDLGQIIIPVTEPIDYYVELMSSYHLDHCKIVNGGKTRQESVRRALEHCKAPEILIHESSRPFINIKFIEKLLDISYDCKGDVIIPITTENNTIYYKSNDCYINRDYVYKIQLPQIYPTHILVETHKRALETGYSLCTDDSSLVRMLLGPDIRFQFVKGLEENIKITTPLDVKIAEAIYNEKNEKSSTHYWRE